jgi:hypothetical protein
MALGAATSSTDPTSGRKMVWVGNVPLGAQWPESVSETVTAAVLLLHERSVEEIAGKFTPAELAEVTRLASRCPSCYPPGAYDTLEVLRDEAAQRLAERTTVGAGSNRPRRRHVTHHRCCVDVPVAGSRFSSESAPRPSTMGFEDEVHVARSIFLEASPACTSAPETGDNL